MRTKSKRKAAPELTYQEYQRGMEAVRKRQARSDYKEITSAILKQLKEANVPYEVFKLVDADPSIFLSAFDREVGRRMKKLAETNPEAFRKAIKAYEAAPKAKAKQTARDRKEPEGEGRDAFFERAREEGKDGIEAVAAYLEKTEGSKQ